MNDVESLREELFALQRLHDDAERSLLDYASIFEATKLILNAEDAEQVEHAMFDGLIRTSGASAAALLEVDGLVAHCTRASEDGLIGAQLTVGPLLQAAMEGKAIALPDIRRPPEFASDRLGSWHDYPAAVLVPFRGRERTEIAVLLGTEVGQFQANDVRRLKVFGLLASQGIASLDRIQLAIDTAKAEAERKAAVASETAKSMFLANMSHEIRTPLNGVLGMAQALRSADLGAGQAEMVDTIISSGRSLMTLLNDVLDFTKIEVGKLELSPTPGDLRRTLRLSQQLFETQAREKQLEFDISCGLDFPETLAFDAVRVGQCLNNLISNAIKFTHSGRISVYVSAKKLAGEDRLVAVEVRDTGIGMSEETMGRLFAAFTQADGASTREYGGSGLGLAISRQLARLMGGDITVTSEISRGSVFRFTFRAQTLAQQTRTSTSAPQPASMRQDLKGLRVLLTDDNAINRQVIKLFLAPQGCTIIEAVNGQDALDKLSTQPFDIVLLDIHMPVMDGVETIRRIRSSPAPLCDMAVVALTADAMAGDREKYLAMGMTDYQSKPIDQRELVSRITTIVGGRIESAARTA